MPVRFANHDHVSFKFQGQRRLSVFLNDAFQKETGKLLVLTVVFCNDEQLLHINRQFLQHDFYTDIITFPIEETDTHTQAEIYISIDRVRENAVTFNKTFEDEMKRVIFHGTLHLCGYKDKSKQQQAHMRIMEENWLQRFAKQQ